MLYSEAFGDEREFIFENVGKCGDGVISGVEYLMGMLKVGKAKDMTDSIFS